MNQGKLEVVKQEMARVNIGILGISEIIREISITSDQQMTPPLWQKGKKN